MRKKNIIIIVLSAIFIIVCGIIGLLIMKPNQSSIVNTPQFSGKFNKMEDTILRENVDKYMESQKEGMTCTHIQYGFEDDYVYTWMLCNGFVHLENGMIEKLSGFSVATRFDYNRSSKAITGYKQPDDGSMYFSSLRKLFPESILVSNAPIKELSKSLMIKYYKNLDPILVEKLNLINLTFPTYKDWETIDSVAGNTFSYKIVGDDYYVAFITNGSGVRFADAKCFKVSKAGLITESDKAEIPINSQYIDPVTCKGTE